MVIPHEIPVAVMARHLGCHGYELQNNGGYEAIARHLKSYQQMATNWDDYAGKIDSDLRDMMARIFQDCRENGFFWPRCIFRDGKQEIVFAQLVDKERGKELDPDLIPDLCMLCEKVTCASRDSKGNYKQDKRYCWRNKK